MLLVYVQPDFHLIVFHDFLKHKMNSLKFLRNGLFPVLLFSLILGLEKFYLGSNLTLLIHVRHTQQYLVNPINRICYLQSLSCKLPNRKVAKGLHLISNDIYLHSTSANHSQGNNLTLTTPNGPFQKIWNLPSHTLTAISFPSSLYSFPLFLLFFPVLKWSVSCQTYILIRHNPNFLWSIIWTTVTNP